MTWVPNEAETKRAFIALYGEELWNQIQELSKPKPLAAREVFRPRKPALAPANDRPALQVEGSSDPNWWDK